VLFQEMKSEVTSQNFLVCATLGGDNKCTIVTRHVKFCLKLDNKHSHKSGIKLLHLLRLCMYKGLRVEILSLFCPYVTTVQILVPGSSDF